MYLPTHLTVLALSCIVTPYTVMKQKTKQAAKKRFSFSSKGKAKHRAIGQAHFNARATGAQTRRKHHDNPVHASDMHRLTDLIPYA